MKKSKEYSDRFDSYMAEKKKGLFLFLALSILFTILAFGIIYPRSSFYAGFAVIIMAPAYYRVIKTAREAQKYARRGGK